jgi:hypothetical protein
MTGGEASADDRQGFFVPAQWKLTQFIFWISISPLDGSFTSKVRPWMKTSFAVRS